MEQSSTMPYLSTQCKYMWLLLLVTYLHVKKVTEFPQPHSNNDTQMCPKTQKRSIVLYAWYNSTLRICESSNQNYDIKIEEKIKSVSSSSLSIVGLSMELQRVVSK